MTLSSGLRYGPIKRSVLMYMCVCVCVCVCACIKLYAYFATVYQLKEIYYGAEVCMSISLCGSSPKGK